MQILRALELLPFWELSSPSSVVEYLRPFQHKLDEWVGTKFSTKEFFRQKVNCQIPMHQWNMSSVARFYMDAGYLTFSTQSDQSHIRLQFPNRSIGDAVAAAIEEPFQSALAEHSGVALLACRHIRAGRVLDAYQEYAKIFRSFSIHAMRVRYVYSFDSLCSRAEFQS